MAVLLAFTVPTMILWRATALVLQSLGATEQISSDAGFFASILALALPGRTIYGQLTQFFAAQKMVRPAAYVSTFGCLLNLILGLVLVLGVFVPDWSGFGFPACPWTTVMTEYSMLAVYAYYTCYSQRLHEECWGGVCVPCSLPCAVYAVSSAFSVSSPTCSSVQAWGHST